MGPIQNEAMRSEDWTSRLTKVSVLGEGASAVSYLAEDGFIGSPHKEVVVKQYKHSYSIADSRDLWREIDVLESIQHDRIPKYLGHYITEQDGRRLLHLVVEYIEGISLEKAMQTYRWTLQQSLDIIHQLLQVVLYLQSLQPPLLHRDIKPSNILVSHQDDGWKVYLIDFGTAIDAIHRTLGATQNAGTIGYMAPEQIEGNPTTASDVYSIGVVAWELLTKHRAKNNLVGLSLEWYHRAVGLPEGVVSWLEMVLDENVNMRIPSAVEAIDVLERIPEFDDGNIVPALPPKAADWRSEAARRWLVIVDSGQDQNPRQAAIKWLSEFGDRCNEHELVGLYHVLHRVALQQRSFRIVEYIQDLVFSTPNGLFLYTELKRHRDAIHQLELRLSSLPRWRVFEMAKCHAELRYYRETEHELHASLMDATREWLSFVGADSYGVWKLLNAPRKLKPPVVNQLYLHLYGHSIGMVQIPSLSASEIFISKMLVTQELFEMIMGFNPSVHKGRLHPVESVSWWDAVIFCNRLSERCGLLPAYQISNGEIVELVGDGFRLPTWVDWKMAARSRQAHRFSGAEDAHLVGWVDKASAATERVAQKEPNAWGLYDMTGNVAEWCWDADTTIRRPNKRLMAGGSYRDPLEWVRIDAYNFEDPFFSSLDLGFRVSRRLERADK